MSIPDFSLLNVAFLRSENGRGGWIPVKPSDVPVQFKDPDTLARMIEGNDAMDASADDPVWWRAVVLRTPQ